MKLILSIVMLFAIATACKTNKKATATQSTTSPEPSTAVAPAQGSMVDLKVMFVSKGSGIDFANKKALEELIAKFETAQNIKLNVYQYSKGREGETNFCFDLKNLSDDKKAELKTAINQISNGSDIIRIKENTNC
jgi:maltose-binding protein MalE